MRDYRACHCCGQIHRLPELQPGESAVCARCGHELFRQGSWERSSARTAAATLGAFLLFLPAITLPILEVDKLGHHHRSSILGGIAEMLLEGDWFVGSIVLVFSILLPLVKLTLLLELSLLGLLHRRHKAVTYRVMEYVGKWSMMDVLLLAWIVMLIKLGDLVRFQFGPGVVAFALCVMMSILASMFFDPHAIWEEET